MAKKTSHQTLKNDHHAKKRVLISVSVLGSTGLIRMIANDDDSATQVVSNALKLYAREGRIPVLGSDPDRYFLYCPDGLGSVVAMGASDAIGSTGETSFLMAPKKTLPTTTSCAGHVPERRTRLAACLNKITRLVK